MLGGKKRDLKYLRAVKTTREQGRSQKFGITKGHRVCQPETKTRPKRAGYRGQATKNWKGKASGTGVNLIRGKRRSDTDPLLN